MWYRIARLLKSGVAFTAFATNPFKYIFAALFVALVPYFIYLFFGVLVFFLLLTAGVFLLYRGIF